MPMFAETSLTLQKGYKCPHCEGHNWRGAIPLGALKCVYCNKMFTPTEGITARARMDQVDKELEDTTTKVTSGVVVHGKEYYGSLHPANQSFRKRIDGFCERFHPEDAYIYSDFAVLHFLTPSDAHKLTDIQQISPMLFAELEVSQKLQWVSLCKKPEGELDDDDTRQTS